ncbi:ABC transporter permease [Halomonas salipaludis]|uniref:Peptide ABC transporter permease n=1 Tax=Halomonas salipaludis TaxID=2032625 RepID=A0A2A2ES09_9GAMM|nr:ABC transporter permease [Halomonas salipaludis]PAU75169.1 peptide ABC transporter permease [Halomonas salipaludis]
MKATPTLLVVGRLYLALVLAFLYLPIVVMATMSFNTSQFYQLPIDWTFDWYVQLSSNQRLLAATRNSILVAMATTLIATVLGTAASIALFRYEFRFKKLFQAALFPPIAIPWLITGTAMLLFFFWSGIGRGLHAMVLGHVALALPYVIIVVSARLRGFDADLEAAARSLGATPWQVVRYVTLPYMAPGIIAGALFAFAVSFDQFVISYFLSVPGISTLPVEIYSAIRQGFTPEINAISTLVIAFSITLLVIVSRFYRFGDSR